MAQQHSSFVRHINSKPRYAPYYTPYHATARRKALGGVPMDHTWSDTSASSDLTNTTTYSVPSTCTTMELDPQDDLGDAFDAECSSEEPQCDSGRSYDIDYSNEAVNYYPSQSITFPIPTDSMPFGFQNQRPTPLRLGWVANMKMIDFYDLVVEKSKEPYLVLREVYPETPRTPRVVYLDRDEGQPHKKDYHPCQFPDKRCWKKGKAGTRPIFRRPADLERHYLVVHASGQSFPCDYPRCNRKRDAFTRKDHCRDHFKEFHKEDLGHCKGEKSSKDKAQLQARQKAWLAERKIDPRWWRCSKCLGRVRLAKSGWQCPGCKRDCEPHRRLARMGQTAGTTDMYDVETEMSLPAPSSTYDSGDEGMRSMASDPESQFKFDDYEPYPKEAYMGELAESSNVYDLEHKTSSQGEDSASYAPYSEYSEQSLFGDVTWSQVPRW